jgi:L-asparaginase
MTGAAFAQSTTGLPKVRVVATGGTIAGEQREPGTLGPYDIKRGVNEIVSMIPNVQRYAQVETEQFSNIPSPAITPADWLRLAQRINAILEERRDLSGIVVTHADRPVVVVGAQRPPTGISPDGPINLLSAIRVAAAPESRGKGVTAVMDDRIISGATSRLRSPPSAAAGTGICRRVPAESRQLVESGAVNAGARAASTLLES